MRTLNVVTAAGDFDEIHNKENFNQKYLVSSLVYNHRHNY